MIITFLLWGKLGPLNGYGFHAIRLSGVWALGPEAAPDNLSEKLISGVMLFRLSCLWVSLELSGHGLMMPLLKVSI